MWIHIRYLMLTCVARDRLELIWSVGRVGAKQFGWQPWFARLCMQTMCSFQSSMFERGSSEHLALLELKRLQSPLVPLSEFPFRSQTRATSDLMWIILASAILQRLTSRTGVMGTLSLCLERLLYCYLSYPCFKDQRLPILHLCRYAVCGLRSLYTLRIQPSAYSALQPSIAIRLQA